MPTAFKDVISQLQKQKSAIERAIAALQDVGEEAVPESGPATKRLLRKARKRTLSAEARERIAEAQRQRWAAVKKSASKSAAKKAKKSSS